MEDLEKEMGDIPLLCPDAVGVVIGVGGRVSSADVFTNPHVFRQVWPKLLRASALAAFCEPSGGSIVQQDAIAFLRSLHGRAYTRKPAIDLGFELTSIDSQANVNALVYREAVLHVAAFPEESARGKGSAEDSERRIRVMRR
jgi:hypothetical protein